MVCFVFINHLMINEKYDFVFLGYDAMSEGEINDVYTNQDNKMSFFGAYEYKKDLILREDMQIYIGDNLTEDLETPKPIDNTSIFFPLFKAQGDYIVIDIRKKTTGALIAVMDGHIASFLAPSLLAHVNDLLEGLNDGTYKIIDDDLIYPSSWHLRQKVRSGMLEMDDYGGII